MEAAWVRRIRAECAAQGVDFFFKQWGGIDKKAAGRELDRFVVWDYLQQRRSIIG